MRNLPKDLKIEDAQTKKCYAFMVRNASRLITKFYDSTLGSSGVKVTQFHVLTALRDSGWESMSSLSNYLGMDRSTLNRNFEVLLKVGYIRRDAPVNAKSKRFGLTQLGSQAIVKAQPYWERAQELFLDRYGDNAKILEDALEAAIDIIIKLDVRKTLEVQEIDL